MAFEVQVAVAKTHKYANRESGDTVELVERPTGGFSVVLVDGQGSGQAAKTLSLLVSAKAVAMLKDGARDGVVARAVHDYLHAFRRGRWLAHCWRFPSSSSSSGRTLNRSPTRP